uniref:Kinase n=1 Tax=Arcella intermedia TaxID=1963864 RepID=A0A6B2LEB9_9EUKA
MDSIIESSTVLGRKISVVMEDLTFAYSRPCIMDIKMGTKTYAEDTNMFKKKIRQLKDDGTTSSRYGLRITGFRTFNMASNQFFEFGKEAAERISNIESMEQKIKDFYFNGNVVRKDVVLYFIERLTLLLSWMNTQNYYRFYSSSLLFVYEGQTEQLFKADVRMIDFAHVHEIRDGGIDEGYVKGLKKLIEILTKLSH